MESSESGSIPVHGVLSDASATFPVSYDGDRPRPHHQIWAIALAAGLGAGLLCFIAGELAYEAFQPRLFKVEGPGMVSMQPSVESQHAADLKNAAVAFAILGCVTALAMGFAGGVAGRSTGRGAMVGLEPRRVDRWSDRSHRWFYFPSSVAVFGRLRTTSYGRS